MGTIECSQPASKSSWDSQDLGDISMVLKMAYFRKSTGPRSGKRFKSIEPHSLLSRCIVAASQPSKYERNIQLEKRVAIILKNLGN